MPRRGERFAHLGVALVGQRLVAAPDRPVDDGEGGRNVESSFIASTNAGQRRAGRLTDPLGGALGESFQAAVGDDGFASASSLNSWWDRQCADAR